LDVPFIHSIYLHLSIVAKVLVLSTQNEKNSLFFDVMSHIDGYDENGKKTAERNLSMKDENFL